MDARALIQQLAVAEAEFLTQEFLAPILPGGRVQVRIAGLICTLRVRRPPRAKGPAGWAILKPQSLQEAAVVGQPSLSQIRAYLLLFPAVRLVLLARASGETWLALPAQDAGRDLAALARLAASSPTSPSAPGSAGKPFVYLAAGGEPFQQVLARYTGGYFLFQEVDRRRNPAIAAYLRQALVDEVLPADLHKPTLTPAERTAYTLAHQAILAARRDKVEVRLSEALAHAGGKFISYIEREEAYTVAFSLGERQYQAAVQKDNLTVLAAGICLAGQDHHFDLTSLVGVIREGEETRRLNQVYAAYEEETW